MAADLAVCCLHAGLIGDIERNDRKLLWILVSESADITRLLGMPRRGIHSLAQRRILSDKFQADPAIGPRYENMPHGELHSCAAKYLEGYPALAANLPLNLQSQRLVGTSLAVLGHVLQHNANIQGLAAWGPRKVCADCLVGPHAESLQQPADILLSRVVHRLKPP